jgi:hypothetical protein
VSVRKCYRSASSPVRMRELVVGYILEVTEVPLHQIKIIRRMYFLERFFSDMPTFTSFFCGTRFEFRVLSLQSQLSHVSSPFCSCCFGGWVSRTICLGWPHTTIFPLSTSQVGRITGVSHWHRPYLKKQKQKTFFPPRLLSINEKNVQC